MTRSESDESDESGRSIQPGYTRRDPRPSPYPRPAPADPMAGYRRFQLRHIISELTTLLEQLISPELPAHAYLPSHIIRNPPVLMSSSQTTLVNLVDRGSQTDGCPHAHPCTREPGTPGSPPPYAYVHPLSPTFPSSPSDSNPASPDYTPESPDYTPGSPDYTPTTPLY
ncbi:DNA-directed RNA polymerase II subunit RPB1-like isoform X2 [Tachysurus fulvidraco]|uniref:DNA-directed RNA polymerase II subunit RPB1-like isoform X2 n=1 Tax=Tachysurus fulvidraco TaxID=1234273 RepID=UPI001FEF81C9|nr:DNA-directed RNA polymerase II subunit RPB1-like isoform X2 [Tachysurus fulvidraco]